MRATCMLWDLIRDTEVLLSFTLLHGLDSMLFMLQSPIKIAQWKSINFLCFHLDHFYISGGSGSASK